MTDAPLTLNQVTVVGGPAIYIPHGAPMHPPSRDCPYCEVSRLTALYENERSAMQNVQKCAESYRVERDRLTAELALFHRYYGGAQSLTVERNELIAEVARQRAALEHYADNEPSGKIARDALAGAAVETTGK